MNKTIFYALLLVIFSAPIKAGEKTIGIIITTDLGVIEAELYPDRAPITVANFVKNITGGLYEKGYFWRTVKNFTGPHPIATPSAWFA